ncbi:hypothetical protein [Dyella sp. C9]|uniref:hypothetical protein n=1 Tax=Dyella sp. C9 TaxID=2202154 RepID=UPI000DEEE810|nr:hypothetical protein [Dyella sp. C9]
MKIIRTTAFAASCLLTMAAWAQSTPPLNLKLPVGVPAASSSAAPASSDGTTQGAGTAAATGNTAQASNASGNATSQANAQTGTYSKDPPGTYYGDTSGAVGDTQAAVSQSPTVTCDDATYNQPQVHGAVTTGVVSGNHFSGGYTGGGVTLSQAFGSCEHPTGGMSISVGGTSSHFGH